MRGSEGGRERGKEGVREEGDGGGREQEREGGREGQRREGGREGGGMKMQQSEGKQENVVKLHVQRTMRTPYGTYNVLYLTGSNSM